MEKIKVKALEWLHSKEPTFNAGETRTAKATLTSRPVGPDLHHQEYVDVTKVAGSGMSSSFALQPGRLYRCLLRCANAGQPWSRPLPASTLMSSQAPLFLPITRLPMMSRSILCYLSPLHHCPMVLLGLPLSEASCLGWRRGTYSWSVVTVSARPDAQWQYY